MTAEEENPQKEKLDKAKDRLAKWEDNRRSQLSFTNNLLNTFGFVGLGFIVKLSRPHYYYNWSLISTFCLLAFSLLFGLLLTICRLLDYRYTCEKIRNEKKNIENPSDEFRNAMNKYRCYYKICSKLTWLFLTLQIISIAASFFFFFLYFISHQ